MPDTVLPLRFAVHRLHLPDGRVLPLQVVETDGKRPLRYHPLTAEEPFTQWLGGDFYFTDPADGHSRIV